MAIYHVVYLFFFLEVHAIFPTPGLVERGDVCDVRAAETSPNGSEPQLHSCTVTIIVCEKADVVAQGCCLQNYLRFVAS